MLNPDRWLQRWQSFQKAYLRLEDAIKQVDAQPDNLLLQAGLIQTYEFTFELAWKTMKDHLELVGFTVSAPREVLRTAFQEEYIVAVDVWLKALDDRNKTAHAYDEEMAKLVVLDIVNTYFPVIKIFYAEFSQRTAK